MKKVALILAVPLAWMAIHTSTVVSAQSKEHRPLTVVDPTPATYKPHDLDLRGAEKITFAPFGDVALYRPKGTLAGVALFYSGDGGWNKGVVDMAMALVELDVMVVGIDIRNYFHGLTELKSEYAPVGIHADNLSKFIQKKENLPRYFPPLLVGYSSGATLVYLLLATVPPNTFLGAISLGFCPDLMLPRPIKNSPNLEWTQDKKPHNYIFRPTSHLLNPWVLLQGDIDQVCDSGETRKFAAATAGAEVVELPKVGHGFAVTGRWLPQYKEACTRILACRHEADKTTSQVPSIADLPLIELPLKSSGPDLAVIILTGDGGWAGIDREIGEFFATKGIPVIGWDTLQYFWKPRSPDQMGRDLERIMLYTLDKFKKNRLILIGYSFGGDTLPFAVSRIKAELGSKVALVVLLGPEHTTSFEFHLTDWLGINSKDGQAVLPEVQKLTGFRILCLHGQGEGDSICPELHLPNSETIELTGGHHFGGAYSHIAEIILEHLPPAVGHLVSEEE